MDMKKMMKQAQRMQAELAKAQDETKELEFEATAGGGMVKVVAKGDMTIQSIAIDPEDGVITAPFDGTVTAVYPTKHAVGLTSVDGVECIIHVGVDTANLQGKHFDVKVQEGQKVKTGDVISQVDLAAVIKEGYSLVTPVLITNSADYLDVLPNEKSGMIVEGEPLLTVIK